MNKFIIFCTIYLSLFSIPVGLALDVQIDISNQFVEGEKVFFNYSIISSKSESIQYFSSIKCNSFPNSLLERKSANLVPQVPVKETYNAFLVDNSVPSQNCTAIVEILYPFSKTYSKNFTINTNPSFSLDVKLSKKVFTKGEKIYLDYLSSVENPVIKAKLIYPDGTSKDINLPYSFKSGQIGTYNLDVSAAKQGYNNVSKQEIFGVIEKQAEINSIDENGNAISSTTNNGDNVNLVDKIKEFGSLNLIIILVIIAGLISLIVIIYLTRKKEIKERDEPYI